MDSGLAAEPVIGPRFVRTRWRRPGDDEEGDDEEKEQRR